MALSKMELDSFSNVLYNMKGTLSSLPKWKSLLLFGSPVLAFASYFYVKRLLSGNSKSLVEALSIKEIANEKLKLGQSQEAIALYTRALDACPLDHAMDMSKMLQNRALAHEILGETDRVIADCDAAIEADPQYVRAIARRAKAKEKMGDLVGSLEDATLVCLLEDFKNNVSMSLVDRLIKLIGQKRASDRFSFARDLVTPSPHFMRTYLASFVRDPIFGDSFDEGRSRETHNPFLQARRLVLECRDLHGVVDLCNREIESNRAVYVREAWLLKATFLYLGGAGTQAAHVLNQFLEKERGRADSSRDFAINALIKRASVRLQCGSHEEASQDLFAAQRLDPDHPDVYHHRGQLRISLEELALAAEDFETCARLAPNFPLARVHGCYTRYRREQELSDVDLDPDLNSSRSVRSRAEVASREFDDVLTMFPDCAEGWALYGQIMADCGDFARADEMYIKALEIEPDNGNVLVHRALCHLQWKYDPADSDAAFNAAMPFLDLALEADPLCEFALETLGTLEVQRGGYDLAVDYFDSAVILSKTEAEMAHLYSLREAACAQRKAAEKFRNFD